MNKNKTILDEIFAELKKRRIALTIDEYAKMIDSSRASLFRFRDAPDKIDPKLIERANRLLIESKRVSLDEEKEALRKDLIESLKSQLVDANEKIEVRDKKIEILEKRLSDLNVEPLKRIPGQK